MGDLALRLTDDNELDLVFEDDDLACETGLLTSVLLSLFLDRQAEVEDVLPGYDPNRRGWWGDQFQGIEGDKIGSREWLVQGGKLLPELNTLREQYADEALAWMLEDGVAEAIRTTATIEGSATCLAVEIQRPQDPVPFRFNALWEDTADAL